MAESKNRMPMLAASYIGAFICCFPLPLVPLFIEKDDEFVRWHAKRGFTLWLLMVVVMVAFQIVVTILSAIISALGFLQILAGPIWLVFAAINVLSFLKANKGEKWALGPLGSIADKVAPILDKITGGAVEATAAAVATDAAPVAGVPPAAAPVSATPAAPVSSPAQPAPTAAPPAAAAPGEDAELARLKAQADASPTVQSFLELGRHYQALGRADEALQAFHQGLEKDQNNLEAYRLLAPIYMSRNDLDRAQNAYQWIQYLDPNDQEAPLKLAEIQTRRG